MYVYVCFCVCVYVFESVHLGVWSVWGFVRMCVALKNQVAACSQKLGVNSSSESITMRQHIQQRSINESVEALCTSDDKYVH